MQSPRAVTNFPSRSDATALAVDIRSCARWTQALRDSDIDQLWAELHRLVRRHPLVRASRRADLLIEEKGRNSYTDLTQELFVRLLGKKRFQHYLLTQMTDAEIECEISQIELSNLLTAELRKRYPESYRLARRISSLIQTSTNFRCFDSIGKTVTRHQRLVNKVYGLSEWPDDKVRCSVYDAEQRVLVVPICQRDRRLAGRTGDAQIIITNDNLERLITSVLEAVDAPVNVRTLRSLVMSRLSVINTYLVPLDITDEDKQILSYEPADEGENPEQELLRREAERKVSPYVNEFLISLKLAVRGKNKQYKRIMRVLWHCYLSPQRCTQLEVAATLGVSDSLVSDYRSRIEQSLRALSFFTIEEARRFETTLRVYVRALVTVTNEEHGAGYFAGGD